jgi:hypothetical protein
LYDFYGVDPDTGASLYQEWEEDEDGNTTPVFDEAGEPVLTEKASSTEKGYIGGSSLPDLYGSLTNSFSYKNFRLDVMMTYGIGGKIYDGAYRSLMTEGDYGEALHVDLIDGWRNPGDVTDIPRMEFGNTDLAYGTTDRWLTDASYLTFKNVNLSYTFGKDLTQRMGVKALKVFVVGENLYMFTARRGMNPQESFAGTTSNVYLPQRTFSVGVNLSF